MSCFAWDVSSEPEIQSLRSGAGFSALCPKEVAAGPQRGGDGLQAH